MDQSLAPAAADDKKASQQTSSEFTVSDVGPNLDRLWSYQCSTTKGRNVSCIGWNVTNPVCTAQTPPADSNTYTWREMYSGHAGLSVCLSAAACRHYCTDPDVSWGMVEGAPTCAVLGEFAISARIVLLWQHSANVKCQRVHACTRCMPGLLFLLTKPFKLICRPNSI